MNKASKIYVSGHNGLVGSAILRCLQKNSYQNIIYKNSKELDLRRQSDVESFFESEKPEYVFLSAGKVGGIKANNEFPAQFIYDNLMIESNIIHTAYKYKVKKLLFLGSSCIYPKLAEQPIKEEYLLTGKLEPTNEAYALAKIVGIKLCEFYRNQYQCDFISAMPTNLYGINDNFDLNSSHVLPALISKIHTAKQNNSKEIVVWGTGKPKREFLYVDDLADALLFLMLNYSESETINIGTGNDIEILELVSIIKDVISYNGEIKFDTNMPNGTMRKVLNVEKIHNLGWTHKMNLKEGIEKVYNWYLQTKV